jgi:hypothetical protein
MRSKKIIKTAKQAIKEACFAVFDASVAIWDFVACFKEDSALSGWLGIAMIILCAFEIYFFKKAWVEFKALCAEIKD